MKRKMINLGAFAVVVFGSAALAAPAMAKEASDPEFTTEAECTIGNVTVKGDICSSDGTTCKCA